MSSVLHSPQPWSPDSWRGKSCAQQPFYRDDQRLQEVKRSLAELPPLVTSFEVERLRTLLAEAQQGKRFLLQGGDCAERIADCQSEPVARRLKILLQMSLVLTHGLRCPVVRVGRFAGQYAKPRSAATETRIIEGRSKTLPSYFGDLINRLEFTEAARQTNPDHMLECYYHSALTLNFVRALVEGGFTDLRELDRWDLSFLTAAGLTPERRAEYQRMTQNLADGLSMVHSLGGVTAKDPSQAAVFSSHEGLHLDFEQSLSRAVPGREGSYDLSTHFPWIGDRTRSLDGAHVEFFRGIRNPIAVKLGPSTTRGDVVDLARVLNPKDEPGRLTFITRLGANGVEDRLPAWIAAMKGHPVLWVCDPMHGNTSTTQAGYKTRNFESIAEEFERTLAVHERSGSYLGGLHVEVTPDDVTECVGGTAGPEEATLNARYQSACDPRLNYQQALELAFRLAHHVQNGR
jgi:3-deoxy-7-phosphoheptulonate synthase